MTRPSNDHYPTPPEFVRALFSVESFCGSIWEPCCGSGEMGIEIMRCFPHFSSAHGNLQLSTIDSAAELKNLGCLHWIDDTCYYVEGSLTKLKIKSDTDFLKEAKSWGDNIITNPPYSIVDDIVEHALNLNINGKVAMLLNTKWDTSLKRYDRILKHKPPSRIWGFVDRLAMYPKNYVGKKGSPTENYAWFIWDKSHIGATNKSWLKLKDFKE